MTAARHLTPPAELCDSVVAVHQLLARARTAVASFFERTDENADAAYALAWDVAPILERAATRLVHLVRLHDLAGPWARFWENPTPAANSAPGGTLLSLHNDLEAADKELLRASSLAATLTRGEPSRGAIGWDLEIALDDVLIDLRDAANAAGFAGQPYWAGVL